MLRFLNFKKSYGAYPALQIPDLQLENGIYWVKGINGSGKSTLLKSIAGMLAFDGDILLESGISIKKHPVNYRGLVNFSEAEPIFPGFLSGMEMIDLFVKAKNASVEQKGNLIDQMRMNEYVNHPIKSYSSGMLKKLSLLLAFLGKPKVILLDEPLITIDTESLKILYNWIAEEHRTNGITFLLTTHQPLDSEFLPEARELLVESQTLKSMD